MSKEFIIHIDHETLKYLKSQHKLNKRHAKWVEFLEQFPYIIKYKKGKSNVVADALFRRYTLLAKLGSQIHGFDNICELYSQDPFFAPIYSNCLNKSQGGFYVSNCYLFKLSFSTSCQPQTDGQTEVVNRSLSTFLRVVLKGNHKSWDEYLPHIEFAYNRVVQSTTKLSPFEVVYGFNLLTPLELLPLPSSFDFVHKEGVSKSQFIKDFHEKVKSQIQAQIEKIANSKNKGKRVRSFNEGDFVWLHLRKEIFPQL